ncbi:MAG: extracellular solute-binding protein [Eubacteriales bacterium]
MKKKIILLCSMMLTMCLVSACGQSETTTEEQVTEKEEVVVTEEEVVESTELVVWHDGDESIMQVIEEQLNDNLSGDGIIVKFEKKSGLTDQIKLYGSDEANGPDMYVYAHDSLGTFVEMDVLAPLTEIVDETVYDDLLEMTVEAGSYNDEQYLLPLYFETLLFMYNKDLWEGEIPQTTEDLYAYMVANTDVNAGTYVVVNQHSTAYNVSPFIYGFGGYIINDDGIPGLNDENTKEAIVYNQKFAELQADGDYNTVNTLFNEGKAQAIIGGPWLISGINDAGINLGIYSLANFELPNGEYLAPFSGVQGVGVMKYSVEDNKEALAKVIEALCDPELGIALANQSNCAPANALSYEDESVQNNEMIVAMKETAETAEPMPNIPEMGVMWGPAESLLAAVNKSGADIDSAADEYQKASETAISDMQ